MDRQLDRGRGWSRYPKEIQDQIYRGTFQKPRRMKWSFI